MSFQVKTETQGNLFHSTTSRISKIQPKRISKVEQYFANEFYDDSASSSDESTSDASLVSSTSTTVDVSQKCQVFTTSLRIDQEHGKETFNFTAPAEPDHLSVDAIRKRFAGRPNPFLVNQLPNEISANGNYQKHDVGLNANENDKKLHLNRFISTKPRITTPVPAKQPGMQTVNATTLAIQELRSQEKKRFNPFLATDVQINVPRDEDQRAVNVTKAGIPAKKRVNPFMVEHAPVRAPIQTLTEYSKTNEKPNPRFNRILAATSCPKPIPTKNGDVLKSDAFRELQNLMRQHSDPYPTLKHQTRVLKDREINKLSNYYRYSPELKTAKLPRTETLLSPCLFTYHPNDFQFNGNVTNGDRIRIKATEKLIDDTGNDKYVGITTTNHRVETAAHKELASERNIFTTEKGDQDENKVSVSENFQQIHDPNLKINYPHVTSDIEFTEDKIIVTPTGYKIRLRSCKGKPALPPNLADITFIGQPIASKRFDDEVESSSGDLNFNSCEAGVTHLVAAKPVPDKAEAQTDPSEVNERIIMTPNGYRIEIIGSNSEQSKYPSKALPPIPPFIMLPKQQKKTKPAITKINLGSTAKLKHAKLAVPAVFKAHVKPVMSKHRSTLINEHKMESSRAKNLTPRNKTERTKDLITTAKMDSRRATKNKEPVENLDTKVTTIKLFGYTLELPVKRDASPPIETFLPQLTMQQKNEFRDACAEGSPADILAILNKGDVLVNDALEHSWSGLQHASYAGRADNVKVLLDAGADPNFKRYDAMTVLMSAACCKIGEDTDDILECAKLLCEAGARLDALHDKSITALIFAVKLGHTRMVSYFLDNGAASLIDHRDINTRSALDWAAFMGKAKIVRILLEHGANVFNTNRFAQTPAEVAAKKGFEEIANLITVVQTTKWRPGKDPKLIQKDKEQNAKLEEVKKKGRILMLKTYEEEHMEMILDSLNLQKVVPLFKKHGITYFDFLRLKDAQFHEIGVTEKADRAALLRVINETTPSIFTEDTRPTRFRGSFTKRECYNVLANSKNHLKYLRQYVRTIRSKIAENPSTLIVGSEGVGMQSIIQCCDAAIEAAEEFSRNSDRIRPVFVPSLKGNTGTLTATACRIEAKKAVRKKYNRRWSMVCICIAGGITLLMVKKDWVPFLKS